LTGANVLVPIDRFLVVRVGHGNHGGFHGSKEEWVPLTKFGQLGKTGKLRKVEEVYLHSLAIKEHQVLETLVPGLMAVLRESLEEEHRELEVEQQHLEVDRAW
jgi:hypothetical protein